MARLGIAASSSFLLAVGLALAPGLPASASDGVGIDFTASGYTTGPGSPAGQNGWTGSPGARDRALVDHDDPDYAAAGLPAGQRSLQISSAAICGSAAPLVSPLIEPAGESVESNTFDVTFTVVSATGALQPGLNVDVNLDGASRYGGVVNLRHADAGLAIGSHWVPATATTAELADWRSTVFTTVPADVPHIVRIVTVYLPDAADLLDVYVDGVLVSGGSGVTTWERYHEIEGTGGDRTVDSISLPSPRRASRRTTRSS